MKTKFSSHFVVAPAIAWSLVAAPAFAQETVSAEKTVDSATSTTTATTTANPTTTANATSSTREAANSAPEVAAESASTKSTSTDAEGEAEAAEQTDVSIAEPLPSVETVLPINPNAGRLTAETVRYEGSIVVAENTTSGKPVVFQTADARIEAKRLRLDTANKTLHAEGDIYVERQRRVTLQPLVSKAIEKQKVMLGEEETVTETLRGQDFRYDFKTQKGSLDRAKLSLTGFTVSTDELVINGKIYTAKNVLLRPGGLTEAQTKELGTPPFNIRAKTLTIDTTGGQTSTSAQTGTSATVESGANISNPNGAAASRARIGVKGGALYFKNTKLLPIPSYFLNSVNRGPRDQQAFNLTPRISFSSVDRVLVTTQLRYPLTKDLNGLALNADVGLSANIGLRGGVELEAPTRFGSFGLGLRKSDIVTSQLTSRIELDRTPELTFRSRFVPVVRLPGKRVAGISLRAGGGRFRERLIGEGGSVVSTERSEVAVNFTTRGNNVAGPYLDMFARVASYGNQSQRYRNSGFEIGYAGKLFPRVNGVLSYRATSLKGETPFRFDRVEIARELRGTVDLEVTPRYIIPLDLRYDLDSKTFRDRTVGVLRNYKTFAYGVVYQSARNELRAEIRQGF